MFVCVYIYIQSKKDQDQKFTGKAFMLIAKLLTPILVLLVPIYSGLLINGKFCVCVCWGGGGGVG